MKSKIWNAQDQQQVGEYIRTNGYRSEQHKLLYIATPKVACTSLKWWFAALEGYADKLQNFEESHETDPDLIIHDSFMKIAPNVTGLSLLEAEDAIFSSEFYRFSVVRNPYKRVFSAWQSKILLQEPAQGRTYSNQTFYQRSPESIEGIRLAFEEFLEYLILNEAPQYLDYHWTPQFDLLRPDLIDYSIISKIEDTSDLVKALSQILGPDSPSPFASRKNNESLIPYDLSFMSSRSIGIIKELYAKDFEFFKYDQTPPESSDELLTDKFETALKAVRLIRGRNQRILSFINQQVKAEQRAANLESGIYQKDYALEGLAKEINHLESVITEKDHALESQINEIHRLESAIGDKDNALEFQTTEIRRLESAIKDKDSALESQTNEIRRLESVIRDKDSALESQTNEIRRLESVIRDKDSALESHTNEVSILSEQQKLKVERDYVYSEIEKRDVELKKLYVADNKARAEILTLFEELTRIKSSRAYRLATIRREMPFGLRKLWIITRLIMAGILPKSVINYAKKAPLLNKLSAPPHTPEMTGAYTVKQPRLIDSTAPVVVHIIANFMTGGSSRLVVDLVEHLGQKYKHFVLTSLNPIPPAYVGINIEECRFPEDISPFKEYYERIQPDFIHVHYWGDCDEPWYSKAIEAAAALGIPVIENINTPIPPYRSNIISKYIYVSDYVRHVFGQNQDSGKSLTIYPGSNFELFNRRSDEDAPEDCVGMVYRLERDKLNEDSIKPFIRIAQLRPRTKILIVGGGSLLDGYKAAAKEAGVIDNFEFTGYVDYDVLPALYRRMSLFIAPVWKESFGQVSPFAMSMKVPVIGYDIGAIPEIIGTSELVAPHDSPDKLAQIAIRLLDSPAERVALGATQQKRAQENFSVEAMITNYAEVYSEVISTLSKDQM